MLYDRAGSGICHGGGNGGQENKAQEISDGCTKRCGILPDAPDGDSAFLWGAIPWNGCNASFGFGRKYCGSDNGEQREGEGNEAQKWKNPSLTCTKIPSE